MRLVDSHCHLDFPIFDSDREEVLNACKQQGITDIIVPGVSKPTWQRLLTVCQSSDMLHPALGLHPMFMHEHSLADIEQLADAIKQHQPVAIGEIGLDFFVGGHDKQTQLDLFEQQLVIAKQYELPVILHIRKAYDQALASLKKHRISRGIVHAFSGSEQQAQHFIKQGFLLGIGGVVTYSKATKIRRIFKDIELSQLVLETDAPDMPLANAATKRNSPTQIPVILESLSKLRGEAASEIAQITTRNVEKLLFSEKLL